MTAPTLRLSADSSHPIYAAGAADALDELCKAGHLSSRARLAVRRMAGTQNAAAADVLLATGWAEPDALGQADHKRWGAGFADLANAPPSRALIDIVGVDICLRYGLIPWRKLAGGVVVACADPSKFDQLAHHVPSALGIPIMALATRSEIQGCIARLYREDLVLHAETRGEPGMTCRDMVPVSPLWIVGAFALVALSVSLIPQVFAQGLFLFTLLLLTATSTQKLILAVAALRKNNPSGAPTPVDTKAIDQAPVISLFIPLLREAEIAAKLITSIEALRYPRALLEVMFLVEEDDNITRAALDDLFLQPHMRVIYVPRGSLKTKPRAMNYALPFAKGEIIGIYDAEDRPEADQLLEVAAGFATAPPNVACLQGRLAFYNGRQNLLSRCFSLDYAAWFRLMLPGLAALDLPIPLGGTTLFLRRHIVDKLDGWDAHNVTEDAELGFRLYGEGYRVQLLDSTTFEEANCHAWPWIKQRSRWMKGYLKTWLIMMRKPVRLFKRLGFSGFVNFQVLVFCSVASATTAPVLWSMFLPIFGYDHPMLSGWSPFILPWLLGAMVIGEVISLGIFAISVAVKNQRWLLPWIACLPLYFILATPAAIRALFETARNPHHWDKTSHGTRTKIDPC